MKEVCGSQNFKSYQACAQSRCDTFIVELMHERRTAADHVKALAVRSRKLLAKLSSIISWLPCHNPCGVPSLKETFDGRRLGQQQDKLRVPTAGVRQDSLIDTPHTKVAEPPRYLKPS